MTTIDFHSSTLASSRSTNVNSAVTWVAAAFRAWKNRRAFYRLGELSDVQLHDIGLTRADLHVAIDQSFTHDPTAQLSRTAKRRTARMETWARYRA